MAVVLIPIALILPLKGIEKVMLIGSVLLVLVVELLNTAVESVVDRVSEETHHLSKRAKDAGSAAVFISLVILGITWFTLCSSIYFESDVS
jgi:diacylglycerol kinase (ATP)